MFLSTVTMGIQCTITIHSHNLRINELPGPVRVDWSVHIQWGISLFYMTFCFSIDDVVCTMYSIHICVWMFWNWIRHKCVFTDVKAVLVHTQLEFLQNSEYIFLTSNTMCCFAFFPFHLCVMLVIFSTYLSRNTFEVLYK